MVDVKPSDGCRDVAVRGEAPCAQRIAPLAARGVGAPLERRADHAAPIKVLDVRPIDEGVISSQVAAVRALRGSPAAIADGGTSELEGEAITTRRPHVELSNEHR